MPTVVDVCHVIDSFAPERYAFSFDRVGLQVGDPQRPVTRGVVSLDHSLGAIDFACKHQAQVFVAHHPLIFEPARSVTTADHIGRAILRLAEAQIAFVAAHTNWDSARGGINDRLAALLGLEDLREFGSGASIEMLKVVVFAPKDITGQVLEAASLAGAGVLGNYHHCSFQVDGTGTFFGDDKTSPTVGESGRLERVPEVRLEMVCRADQRAQVERAIRSAHTYEEPAIDFLVTTPKVEQPAGRIGRLHTPQRLVEWVRTVESVLATKCLAWGDPDKVVERIAVVGGAADSEWKAALHAGADVFLTGEVRQHHAVEVSDTPMALVQAGHYATEHPGCAALAERLRQAIPNVEWLLYEPPAGTGGRPLN